eukprot:Blabericola_migrator_1__8989@NODE_4786_length_981_cov_5_250547_g2984_i0_p1_GENE_NODE_4786_length_981_cov_5_250547_g2984_i0NODE_4786_length_981_cov_5_250547_g2984_i0_p1_ORF_typecomplete_len271_score34_91_NODE_4786_length_981_cov_5_250547_g2984_i0135947
MSARHLQKLQQINIKDGTIGTALLVTLAFDSPGATGVLENTSYVPPTSWETMSGSSKRPNSAEMTWDDYNPPDNKQKWNSLMMSCLLQLAQASLVERDGVPFMPKLLGELYTPLEVRTSSSALRNMPEEYKSHQCRFVLAVNDLMRVLAPEDQARWEEYVIKHKLNEDTDGNHAWAIRQFHAAQWFFATMPIEFQKNHVIKIAKMSDTLAEWVTDFLKANPRVLDMGMPHNFDRIPNSLIVWKYEPSMLELFDEVTTYFKEHHSQKRKLL